MRATPLLVGVRHILDVEAEDWLLREDKVFDCLVRPPTLKHVATIGEILVVTNIPNTETLIQTQT